MAYEVCWDQTWERVNPGHYTNDRGMEIIKSDTGWVLSDGRNEDTTYRTLKAAKAAADEV